MTNSTIERASPTIVANQCDSTAPAAPYHWLKAPVREFGTLLFYQLVAAILFYQVTVGSATFLGWGDAADQSYPWLMKVWHAAQQGQLALWDFGTCLGSSFVGELQTAPFYPISLMFAPIVSGHDPHFVDMFIVLHFGLAGYFTHRFLRDQRCSWSASFLGSILFCFASNVTLQAGAQPNIFCGIAFMPLALLSCGRAISAGNRIAFLKWSAMTGLAMALAILSGHVHDCIYTTISVMVFLLIRVIESPKQRLQKAIALGLLALATALAIAGPQIALTQEYLHLAYKWCNSGPTVWPHIVPLSELRSLALHTSSWATLLPHDSHARELNTLFLTVTGYFLILSSLFCYRSLAFRTSLAILLVGLILSFAGHGVLSELVYNTPVLNLVRSPRRALQLYDFGGACLAAFGLDFIANTYPRFRRFVCGFFVACVIVEAARFAGFSTHPVTLKTTPYQTVINNRLTAVLEKCTADDGYQFRYAVLAPKAVSPNLGEVIPVFSTSGYRATMPIVNHDCMTWDYHSEFMDILSTRYLVTQDTLPDLQERARVGAVKIYDRPTALPMFWHLDESGKCHRGPIGNITWGVNDVKLRLATPLKGFIVFSQPMFPGWHASVDGKRKLLEKWRIFPVLPVTGAEREIVFSYQPSYLPPLICLMMFAYASILLLFVWDSRRFHVERQELGS